MSGKLRKHVPLRNCIACHQKRPKRELVRVVRTPEGTIEVDLRGKAAGRGAYLCPNRHCWDKILDGGALRRALKCEVTAQDLEILEEFARSLPVEQAAGNTSAPSAYGSGAGGQS